MKHVSIRVYGKVQGVFFRASALEKAEELGINGNVRNNPDGGVGIEAEGGEENLQAFIAWCNRGPKFAQVERCDVNDAAFRNYKGFTIERA